jgi:two-component system sensor histidine kinase/response regulator
MAFAKTILLAEDDPDTVLLLQWALQEEYQLTLASDGIEAIERLQEQLYDLVLLDMHMPGLGGLEVCRKMKLDPRLARIPVIFMTAFQDQELLVEAFEAGGVDYLSKPVFAQELLMRIRTHIQLSAMERELRQQVGMRDLVVLTLSHDLRGPIGAAVGLIDRVAKDEQLPERVKNLAQAASNAALQGYSLLDDMLTWAQAMGDKLTFTPTWLSFQNLGTDCLNTVKAKALQKGLRLVLEAEPELLLFADRSILRTILLNLLENAIKFTSQGTITLRGLIKSGQAVIEVEDTGRGIPAAVMSQLAQYRPIGSQLGTAGERGTGMGLKICQEFTTYHNGTLQLSSKPNQGSLVSILLPQPAAE